MPFLSAFFVVVGSDVEGGGGQRSKEVARALARSARQISPVPSGSGTLGKNAYLQ